jgi:hypothetical protein
MDFTKKWKVVMATLKSVFIAFTTVVPLLAFSLPSQAAINPTIERVLISICKSVTTNKVYKYKRIAKSYHLKDRAIALKVVCNGQDIISFAESYGADKTAAKLQRSLGDSTIIDIAATERLQVTFTDEYNYTNQTN